MKAKVYTIASGKGGTGKTTTTINLGVALAALYSRYFERAKVIMVDADVGMANMGLALGLEECPVTLHEVLAGKANVKDARESRHWKTNGAAVWSYTLRYAIWHPLYFFLSL